MLYPLSYEGLPGDPSCAERVLVLRPGLRSGRRSGAGHDGVGPARSGRRRDIVRHALLVARHHVNVVTAIERTWRCRDQAGLLAGCGVTAGSTTFADLVASTEPARMSTNAAIIGTVSGSLSSTTPAVTATAGLT